MGMLSAESIIDDAQEKAGIADPEPHLHANLRVLVESLNRDGRFGLDGDSAVHKGLVGRMVDRLEGLKWCRDYPEIGEEVIREPVFLTGLPRSGTTYFQYLFDRDRRFRLIRTWEGIMPNPPPGHDAESVTRRKAIEAEIKASMRPDIEGFDALHLIDLDGPEECHIFMEQSWSAAGFFNLYDAPEYFDFLMDGLDLAKAYQVHKRQLQLLQWKYPQPRWAVKYPNHVIGMDAILQVHPDARFVMTHRDPMQTLASIAKMTFTLRSARQGEAVDPHRVGRQMLDFIKRHIDRIMAFSTGPHGDRVTHVDYYRLVADPAALISEIHAGLGIDTPDDVRESIAGWRSANPKDARGKNAYTLEQFGIRAEEALELYSDYIRRFDIPREAEGVGKQQ